MIYLSLWQGLAMKRSRHFLMRTIMTGEIIFVGSLQICMGVYRSFEILKFSPEIFRPLCISPVGERASGNIITSLSLYVRYDWSI